jgi:hypothetical protein
MTFKDSQGRMINLGTATTTWTGEPSSYTDPQTQETIYYYGHLNTGTITVSGGEIPINTEVGPLDGSVLKIRTIYRETTNVHVDNVSYKGHTIDVSWGSGTGVTQLCVVTFSNEYGQWTGFGTKFAPNSEYGVVVFAIPSEDFALFARETSEGSDAEYGGAGTKIDRMAGLNGSGDFIGDQVTGSAKPTRLLPYTTESNIGYHVYVMNVNAFTAIAKQLSTGLKTLWDAAQDGVTEYINAIINQYKGIFGNPLDGVIAVHRIPSTFSPAPTSSINVSKVGIGGTSYSLDVSGGEIAFSPAYTTVNVSTNEINLRETFGDFYDYSNIDVSVYVPFCGEVKIPASSCMDGSIKINFSCDITTGALDAEIVTRNKLGSQNLISIIEGNCATNIPLSQQNDNSIKTALGVAQGVGQIFAGVGTSNPAMALNGIVNTVSSVAGYESHTMVHGSLGSGNRAAIQCQRPFVKIVQKIPVHAEDENIIRGLMINAGGTVSTGRYNYKDAQGNVYGDEINYSGFTVFESVDVSGIHRATDAQKAEIERLLKEGVYL